MSEIVKGLSEELSEDRHDLVVPLAQTLASFSHTTDNCVQLVDAGILELFPKMLQSGFRDPIVYATVDLMWKILDKAWEAVQIAVTPPHSCETSFRQGELRECGVAPNGIVDSGEIESAPAAQTVNSKEEKGEEEKILNIKDQKGSYVLQNDTGAPIQNDSGGKNDTANLSVRVRDGNVLSEVEDGEVDMTSTQSNMNYCGSSKVDSRSDSLEALNSSADGIFRSRPQTTGMGTGPTAIAVPDVVVAISSALAKIFDALLLNGHKNDDRKLRNEILIVISLLIREPLFSIALYNGGFLRTAMMVLKAAGPNGHPPNKNILGPPAANEREDFELLFLIGSAVTMMCKQPQCMEYAVREGSWKYRSDNDLKKIHEACGNCINEPHFIQRIGYPRKNSIRN